MVEVEIMHIYPTTEVEKCQRGSQELPTRRADIGGEGVDQEEAFQRSTEGLY